LNDKEKIAYKQQCKNACVQILQERIDNTRLAIQNAQDAANSEEKSSAGDKFETSRAMSHLEKDMHSKQLLAHLTDMTALSGIDCHQLHQQIEAGSFFIANQQKYFIATGLGKQIIETEIIYMLSPVAPLAQKMWHLKKGEQFVFNNKEFTIEEVF
jgi:hypothetical protein